VENPGNISSPESNPTINQGEYHMSSHDHLVWDSISEKWMPKDEKIARIIARKLGHNDDYGMDWERYILAARGIIDEVHLLVPGPAHHQPINPT
jgi:hypothetical protein